MKQLWLSMACLGLVISLPNPVQASQHNQKQLQNSVSNLEHEVQMLETEVDQLKHPHAKKTTRQAKHASRSAKNSKPAKVASPESNQPYAPEAYHSKQKHPTPQSIGVHPRKVDPSDLFDKKQISYFGGTPIISSPYIGIRSRFDGSDLVSNLPSVNEDLRLLRQRKEIEGALDKNGQPYPGHPLIEISGKIEALTQYSWLFNGKTMGDVDLATAELDFLVNLNTWVQGFMAIDYDNSPPGINSERTSNSRFFLNKGFITVGNLLKCPVYFTFGQFFVPFGRDASNMLSSPLPLIFGRTKERAALIGFQQMGDHGFYAQGYGFRSDSDFSNNAQGGANLGYYGNVGPVSTEAGVSFISTLTDASGQQSTGGDGFGGFAANRDKGSEMLVHRVPGVALYGNFGINSWSFISEFATAVRDYSPFDLTFNNHSARPYATNFEAAYEFHCHDKPASLAIGYGWSGEALGLSIPRERYMAALNFSIWQDTIETLEFRHDNNYNPSNTGAGRTVSGNVVPTSIIYPGRHSDTLTAQIGIYF